MDSAQQKEKKKWILKYKPEDFDDIVFVEEPLDDFDEPLEIEIEEEEHKDAGIID